LDRCFGSWLCALAIVSDVEMNRPGLGDRKDKAERAVRCAGATVIASAVWNVATS
jgi:hypothetical protein